MSLMTWADPPLAQDEGPAESDYDLSAEALHPGVDAWRWADVENDEALRLDMTDQGFCWTWPELEEVTRTVHAALDEGAYITDYYLSTI